MRRREASEFAAALGRWFRANSRELPWRTARRSFYPTWISEVMLQQTRVETVVPYFEGWMKRFPDVAALAAASEEDVLKAWEGLGYYSRARNLHRAAKLVAARGREPRSSVDLAGLPGFGPYTTAAVASLAFGEDVRVIDGNVRRVLARLFATHEAAEDVAKRLGPAKRAGEFNEALMELGATVCTPRAPRCEACPVARTCAARAAGSVARFPRRAARSKPRVARVAMAYVERGGRVLVVRREKGLGAGLWTLPWVEGDDAALFRELGLRQSGSEVAGRFPHVHTHVRWQVTLHVHTHVRGAPRVGRWVARADLATLAMPRAARKAIALIRSEVRGPSSPARGRRPSRRAAARRS